MLPLGFGTLLLRCGMTMLPFEIHVNYERMRFTFAFYIIFFMVLCPLPTAAKQSFVNSHGPRLLLPLKVQSVLQVRTMMDVMHVLAASLLALAAAALGLQP